MILPSINSGDNEEENVVKRTFIQNHYRYNVIFDDAQTFKQITIDSSGASAGVHVGFGDQESSFSRKIEIVLGGWGGTKSVIRSRQQWPKYGHVEINHATGEWDRIKSNLTIIIADGKIVVSSNQKTLMTWNSPKVIKDKMKFMSVTGGYGASGNLIIQGTRGFNFDSLCLKFSDY